MRKFLQLGFFAIVELVLIIDQGIAQISVPEIPDPMLPDIARVEITPNGPIIRYNPRICFEMGLLACRFFRVHEYGHIVLKHAIGGTFPPVAEMEADCYGANFASEVEVEAAIQAFRIQGMGGDPNHGTGFQRAQRVYDARMRGNCHW